MSGPLNMSGNKVTNLKLATRKGDAVDFEFFNKYVTAGSRDHHSNFNFSNKILYNIAQSGFPCEPIALEGANSKYLWITGRKAMTGNLNMGNNKIINLTNATDNSDATNRSYVDTNFLKLSRGHITGILIV